jgi:hypothetical protein
MRIVVIKKPLAIGLGFGALISGAAMAAEPYGNGYGYGSGYSGTYIGASAGEVLYNESGLSQMAPTILLVHIGQQFSPYLAVEGRVGTSVSGGYAYGYHVNAQAIYAGYVKGMLPVSPWFSPYALLGLGGAQWHRNYPDYNTNDVGVSFGVGGELYLGGGASLDFEWARLTNGSNTGYNYTADQLTFGVNWHL